MASGSGETRFRRRWRGRLCAIRQQLPQFRLARRKRFMTCTRASRETRPRLCSLRISSRVNGNDCAPACSTLGGAYGPFHVWDDQFSSLYAWRSIGNSNYNGLQVTLRHAMSRGLQFDFNYTHSRSIDVGSNAERVSLFEGYGFASKLSIPGCRISSGAFLTST